MAKLFIKNLKIENYKCFESQEIFFNSPDGTNCGSGLNIFVGENGCGKTTVLEAIQYLTLNNYTAESKININDFRDYNKDIIISGKTDAFTCSSSIEFYNFNNWTFSATGIKFIAKNRRTKERGKLLSTPFQVSTMFELTEDQYLNKKKEVAKDKGNKVKTVDGRDKSFDNSRIDGQGIDIFFFDKNRTRQLSCGNYKTTFEKICDDLNWKFVKNLSVNNTSRIRDNICGEYFQNAKDISDKNVGCKLAEDFKNFFGVDEYENLKIELTNILHPFSNAFLAIRKEEQMNQIKVKELGSGIEMILTILLLRSMAKESKGNLILLIDEPELHLHPKAQKKLMQILYEEAKDNQIFISTHSPYIFKDLPNQGPAINIFARGNSSGVEIIPANSPWGLFPWSPTWGEVNYGAFNLANIEFHNELYGFLQEQNECFKEENFDEYLRQQAIPQDKKWIRINADGSLKESMRTICTYIRNYIHHPENTKNLMFTDDEINKSIEYMVRLIKENKKYGISHKNYKNRTRETNLFK